MKFPAKLYNIASTDATGSIWWNAEGDSIIVDIPKFERNYLDTGQFKTTQIGSLVRQLNLYSFVQVGKTIKIRYSDDTSDDVISQLRIYKAPLFHRDRPDLLRRVRRGIVGDGRHPNGEICTCRGDCKMKRKRKRGPNKPKHPIASSGEEDSFNSTNNSNSSANNNNDDNNDNNNNNSANYAQTPGPRQPKVPRPEPMQVALEQGVESLAVVKRWRAQVSLCEMNDRLQSSSSLQPSFQDATDQPDNDGSVVRHKTITSYGRVATAFATTAGPAKRSTIKPVGAITSTATTGCGRQQQQQPFLPGQSTFYDGVATEGGDDEDYSDDVMVTDPDTKSHVTLDHVDQDDDDGGASSAIREVHESLLLGELVGNKSSSHSHSSFEAIVNAHHDPIDDIEQQEPPNVHNEWLVGHNSNGMSTSDQQVTNGAGASEYVLPVEVVEDSKDSLLDVIGAPAADESCPDDGFQSCSEGRSMNSADSLAIPTPATTQQDQTYPYNPGYCAPVHSTAILGTDDLTTGGGALHLIEDIKPFIPELHGTNQGNGLPKPDECQKGAILGWAATLSPSSSRVNTRARSKLVTGSRNGTIVENNDGVKIEPSGNNATPLVAVAGKPTRTRKYTKISKPVVVMMNNQK